MSGVDWADFKTAPGKPWYADLVRIVVMTGCFAVMSFVFASNFDATEVKSISGGAGLAGAALYALNRLSSKAEEK